MPDYSQILQMKKKKKTTQNRENIITVKTSCTCCETKQAKQAHSVIPNLKQIDIIRVNYKKINIQNKQLKIE